MFFFFKQKTAYEMRISDWSSDVCSSDLGSGVAFSGVPVGEVKTIALMPDTPEFVRVRISVNEEVPILHGTTASIEGIGFTGVSQIALDGAIRGAPPIVEKGPEGVPVKIGRAHV